MSELIVKVPDLGGTDSVEVIEISVAQGDIVQEGDSLLVVESDKASMDIPSTYSGKVEQILVSEGASIAEGDPLVVIAASDDAAAATEAEPAPQEESKAPEQESSVSEAPPVTASSDVAPAEIDIVVPDLGGADSVEVIEVCVAAGDSVSEGDSVLVLESDKASMDMPAPSAGTILQVLVEVGASVSEGDRVFVAQSIGADASKPQPAAAPSQEASPVGKSEPAKEATAAPENKVSPGQSVEPSQTKHSSNGKGGMVHAGPAVRKLARELGVDLAKVKATGPKGRIAKEDLHAYVNEKVNQPAGGLQVADAPAVDFAKFGEVETVAMTKMQKLTAANMQRNWLTVPHVTHFDNADITELEVFRASLKPEMQSRGVKISPVAFIVKAVATSLKLNPVMNSSLGADGESLVFKRYVHVGMAVDTEHGLLVPVIRDADKKGLWEIAADITELAEKAKTRKLRPDEMQGACFTISSLGGIGGTGFTPIVNSPEVGILGVSNASVSPVFIDGEFQPRKLLPLALSYDHRVINGGDAGRFMTTLTVQLGELRRMLL